MASNDSDAITITTASWFYVVLPICLSWRIGLANRMPIMDCDEVYNYWEPLHFLLEGTGLQTWEYAHEYALRTYAYLMPLVGVSRMLEWIVPRVSSLLVPLLLSTDSAQELSPKLVLFLVLRSSLAGLMGYAEVGFCRSLEETKTVSPAVARWTLFVLQTCAGLAHASGALLPSTTWTVAWLSAASCFVKPNGAQRFVLLAVTSTLSIGWPFGVIILVPLGVHVLLVQTMPPENEGSSGAMGSSAHTHNITRLLVFIVGVTVVFQAIVMVIDYQFYGIWTSPNLNIFRYNAQGGGDELYGVEPTSYYVKNLLLNFNGVAPLGVLSLGAMGVVAAKKPTSAPLKIGLVTVLLSPMYLWFAIVVPRPHKEERFLFPIYPILCFGAVLTADVLVQAFSAILQNKMQPTPTHQTVLHGLLWIPSAALSSLRILALKKYYAAPLSIYAALHSNADTSKRQLVCTCGEWYRFPSSFTLPPNHELAFLESSFHGQLPQPFSEHGSLKVSQDTLQPFNDQNQHEPTRYSSLQECAYVIDLQNSSDCLVPSWATLVATAPFLDADKTISTLHRTLYVPLLHEQGMERGTIHYQNYALYKL